MTNKIIELASEIQAEQAKPCDETKETDEEYHARIALEDKWIGGIIYGGNSISWSYSKSVNYGRQLQLAWDELIKLGIKPDGNTTVAEAIAKIPRS